MYFIYFRQFLNTLLNIIIFSNRLHGSYEALKYGTRSDGLSDLTGGVVESIPVKSGSDSIRPTILRSILDTTCIITCIAIRGNSSQFKSQPEKLPNGIAIGVSYRLCSLDKVENTMGDSVQLVRLRDPLTSDALGIKTGYNGEWSTASPLWDRVSEQEVLFNSVELLKYFLLNFFLLIIILINF